MFNTNKLGLFSSSNAFRNSYKQLYRFQLGAFSSENIFNSKYSASVRTEIVSSPFKLNFSDSTFNFNSSKIEISKPNFAFSKEYNFSNTVIIDLFSKYNIDTGEFSEKFWFNNANKTFVRKELGNFNEGYLNIEDMVMKINNDPGNTYDYNYFKSNLVNVSQGYLWFDNSVPTKDHHFQTFIRPWGFEKNNFQLSFRFPFFPLNLEYNITHIDKSKELPLEVDLYPATIGDYGVPFETKIDLSRADINLQWESGNNLIRSCQIEYNVSDIIQDLQMEYSTYYIDETEANLEFRRVYKFNSDVDLEYNVTDIVQSFNAEYSVGKESTGKAFDLEYNVTDFISPLPIEYLASAPYYTNFGMEWVRLFGDTLNTNIEYSRVYKYNEMNEIEFHAGIEVKEPTHLEVTIPEVSKHLHLEYTKIYIEDKEIPLEYNIPYIWKDETNQLEYNIPNIWKEPINNIEFRKVYLSTETNQLEYNTTQISKNYGLNIEGLLSATMEKEVNIEFLNPIVAKENFQAYVIPFASNTKNFQMFVKCVLTSDNPNIEFNVAEVGTDYNFNFESNIVINLDANTNIEYNVFEISKEYQLPLEYNIYELHTDFELPLEYKTVYIDNDNVNIETFIEVQRDYFTNIEYNIANIHTDYNIGLETLIAAPSLFPLNIQGDVVIEKDYDVAIEYIVAEIQSFYNLNIEVNTEVHRDILTQIEFVCSEVSKHLHIEFEVLDLVYYFLNHGQNIIPWLYSAGQGNFDETVNKMWDKDNLNNTKLSDGFINQLAYKGYSVPGEISFSDKVNENFGCIISDLSTEDIVLSDKFLVFDRTPLQEVDDFLILGRRKKEKLETVNLKAGKNLLIWDGVQGTFNELIKPQLSTIEFASFWRPLTNDWFTINDSEDHNLYFQYEVEGKLRDMPYVFILKVTEDCTFDINR